MSATLLALEPGYYWHSWTSPVTGRAYREMVCVRDGRWCFADRVGTEKEDWFACCDGDVFEPFESVSGTEARVCQDIAERQSFGIAKYGTTVEQNPLSLLDWLTHAYQECLDQAVYLKRAIEELERGVPSEPLHH